MAAVIEMTSDQALIKSLCESRGVEYVVHFTRESNLGSILQRGLISRDILTSEGCVFNDDIRLDGTNAVCLSLSFPNYKLFYRFRQIYPNERWVVLVFRPELLWSQPAVFCFANAASADVTAIPFEARMLPSALEGIFGDIGGVARSSLEIPDNFPTNPQAEILVSHVDIEHLIGVVVPDAPSLERLSASYQGVQFACYRDFFLPRADYRHWVSGG